MPEPLLFSKGSPGRMGVSLPDPDVPVKPVKEYIPPNFLRQHRPRLPELSEMQVMRHFINLSVQNHHVEKNMYPLGSCTMKYNPKVNEDVAAKPGFAHVHPMQPDDTVQGYLQLLYETSEYLCEISGFDAASLQPAAGAHGELAGLMIIRDYHESRNDQRQIILIPDSAHGTNPASVTIAGYKARAVKSNELGLIDVGDLERKLDHTVAALMLTNPNTLGLFEREITTIAERVHHHGALMYMDGANMNALLGLVKPRAMGFDVMHFNLHKTFSTPHGGGGPGSGPVGVTNACKTFLPSPYITKEGERYTRQSLSPSKLATFMGNIGVVVKAYTYIRMLGAKGLRRVAENAILNANYLKSQLSETYDLSYPGMPLHEFVLSGDRQKRQGVRTLDIAKRLLDYGVHAPTVYFPLIVSEALMIEPTETESKESLDNFIHIMKTIAKECTENPDVVKKAPTTTPVSRLDEAAAARDQDIKHDFCG
jgi:glycine dehydrogenase subunit 2